MGVRCHLRDRYSGGVLRRGHVERREFIGRFLRIFTGVGLLGLLNACTGGFRSSLLGTSSEYPVTISVLQELYADGFQTRFTYLAYSERAQAENYPAIAHLFLAMAASDLIHLRNFENCLLDIGMSTRRVPDQDVQLWSTKENLQRTLEMELAKIDFYPDYLERIKTEGHKPTLQSIQYAVESEKKHREHLQRIQNHAGLRFWLLAKYMETKGVRYYVCQNCGYTVISLPETACPICKRPVSHFKEVEMTRHASR
jgi:rubrerythrin